MENIVKQGENVIKAHLEHLKDHNEHEYFMQAIDFLKEEGIEAPINEIHKSHEHVHGSGGCPGSKIIDLGRKKEADNTSTASKGVSQLSQWPIQIMLVPTNAPYFKGADLLIAADCVSFSYADFHNELLKGKILLIGCPKLDDAQLYKDKISQIFKDNDIKSVTCVHMEVPCCFGLVQIVEEALELSGKKIPFEELTITIKGEKK